MTWNVENLSRPAPGADEEEQRRFQKKLALLARVIAGSDPDVVALQENCDEEPLRDLQRELVVMSAQQ